MADHCFVPDAPGKELFTFLDMLDIALGMMEAISVEEKGTCDIRSLGGARTSASVGTNIDGEPAIRAVGVAMQYAKSGETDIECRP